MAKEQVTLDIDTLKDLVVTMVTELRKPDPLTKQEQADIQDKQAERLAYS